MEQGTVFEHASECNPSNFAYNSAYDFTGASDAGIQSANVDGIGNAAMLQRKLSSKRAFQKL